MAVLFETWKPFLGRVACILTVVLASAGVICWIAGWRDADDYGSALIYLGLGAILLGGLPLTGRYTGRVDPNFHLSQSSDVAPPDKRFSSEMKDARVIESFSMVMVAVGVLSLSIGLLVTNAFA